jgi:hypothetical protein
LIHHYADEYDGNLFFFCETVDKNGKLVDRNGYAIYSEEYIPMNCESISHVFFHDAEEFFNPKNL